MSNEPKKLSEILLERLDAMDKKITKIADESFKSSTTLTPHNDSHKDLDELFNCPTCKAKVLEKAKTEIAPGIEKELTEKQRKERLTFQKPNMCEDCGEVYDAKKETDCPTCHGHHN